MRTGTYEIETKRFGLLLIEVDGGISEARRIARKRFGVRHPGSVRRHVNYRLCQWCESKPCVCERKV